MILEAYLSLFLLVLIGTAALQGACQGSRVFCEAVREIMLRQVSDDLRARLGAYFLYRCRAVSVSRGSLGDTLTGTSILDGRRTVFYLAKPAGRRTAVLYVSVRNEGRAPGINPLTPPQFSVQDLALSLPAPGIVRWEMDIVHGRSGRTKHFSEVFCYDAW